MSRSSLRKSIVAVQTSDDPIADEVKCQSMIIERINDMLEKETQAGGVEKALSRVSQSTKMKKPKGKTEKRPRSARSSSIEPRETRRSLRSQFIDKTIAMASSTVESTDNSCTNSSCGSPWLENKPHYNHATHLNLRTISEDDINNPNASAAVSAADSTTAPEREEKAQPAGDNNNNNNQEVENDQEQDRAEDGLTKKLTAASSSALDKYVEHVLLGIKSRPQCSSEPTSSLQTPCNGRISIGHHAPRRLSVTTCNKGTRMSSSSRLPNPEDPTRLFFESMALTVMGFPQHLQASVKVQVSNIVHELEYELSSPRENADGKIVADAP